MRIRTLLIAVLLPLSACVSQPRRLTVPDEIKAFDIDFNWGPGGPNAFPNPGRWADADPNEHVAWYQSLGCNVIQTFSVSCNGYAWYKNGVVPEQPGLEYDFLPEMVRLGHRNNMLVFGYFCIGANTRWGQTHPALSYGFPSACHIPFTDEYLAYLDAAIRDAVKKTGMDGFMVDWVWLPQDRSSNGGSWLDCEKKLFTQLTGKPFPGENKLTSEQMTAYGQKAIDRCWETIRRAAKETNPHCLVWVTCNDLSSPQLLNSRMLRETDWLLNEAGDIGRTEAAKKMVGSNTRLITCLAAWNGQDPSVVVPAARKAGVGLYGFTKPTQGSLLPPVSTYLKQPPQAFTGDSRNLAVLARTYLGMPQNAVQDTCTTASPEPKQ